MLEIYASLATLALVIWAWGGGVDNNENIWLNKKDRDSMISHKQLTSFGKIIVLSFAYLWNFLVIPWIVIYYTAKGIKKLIVKEL